MTTEEKISAIANYYDYDSQSRQCIEEMAELTQAINKFWRYDLKCGKKECCEVENLKTKTKNIVEEMADVQIMLWQMQELLEINTLDWFKLINQKLERQLKRMLQEKRGKK